MEVCVYRLASGTSISAWLTGSASGETDPGLRVFFSSERRPVSGLYIMNEIILKTTAHVTTSFKKECFCSCLIRTSTQQTLLVKLFPCERSKLFPVGYFYREAEKNKAPSVLRLGIIPQNGKGNQPNMLIQKFGQKQEINCSVMIQTEGAEESNKCTQGTPQRG